MNRLLLFLLCLGFCSPVFSQESFSSGDRDVDSIVSEMNALSFQIYAILKEGRGNTVISPFAISQSMTLPFFGAQGSTESQMKRVLRYRPGATAIEAAFAKVAERYSIRSPYVFSSSIWVQRGPIEETFASVVELEKSFLRLVDFSLRGDSVRSEMNSFMREKTQNKIQDIVPYQALSNLFRLVVLSGAYVKGRLEKTFDVGNSRQMPFFQGNDGTSTVYTMNATDEFFFFDDDLSSVIELPYEGKTSAANLSLLIVLPHELYGLKKVESSLTNERLQKWLDGLKKRPVAISLPRFRIKDSFSLKEAWLKLGLTEPFDDRADFEGIRKEGGSLKLGQVFHQALYSLDEWGSEGTGFIPARGEFRQYPSLTFFKADHPFLFLVIDKGLRAVLLIGRVLSP